MTVVDLGIVLQWGLLAWLAGLATIVCYRQLLGPTRPHGFLVTTPGAVGGGSAQPERVQLLAVFLIAVAGYGLQVIEALGRATEPLTVMPDVPDALLATLAGSQAVYLSGKFTRTLH